jgi:enoyl-CoA hydratase/carnithine racemase
MPIQFETLLYRVEDGIGVITLNRPDKLNAYDSRMRKELLAAFDETDADDSVKAVVLTGTGSAYCAGADLSEGAAAFDPSQGSAALDRVVVNGIARDGAGMLSLRIFNSHKPVIGAVNGAAVGAGVTTLLPLDIRLASTAARFGFVFTRRGVTPEAASSWFLPRIVGISTALEWCYSGRMVSADEALARGLVREVLPPQELMPAAMTLARDFAANSAPVSMALVRQMMWRMLGAAHPMEAHRADTRAIRQRGTSADAKEGVAAFKDKRLPNFPDRVSDGLPDIFPDWQEPEFR